MPRKSITRSLSNEQKKKLDLFLTENYSKLYGYALHQTKGDEDKASDLVQDLCVDLYSGRRVLDYKKSPLTLCQTAMRSIRWRQTTTKKSTFEENGILIDRTGGVTTMTQVRCEMPSDESSHLACEGVDILSLDTGKKWAAYYAIKPTLRMRHQWIVDRVEQGTSSKKMYVDYCRVFKSKMTKRSFDSEISHILKALRGKVEAQFPDDSADDQAP